MVAHRCVAARGAAGAVAGGEEVREPGGEGAGRRLHGHQPAAPVEVEPLEVRDTLLGRPAHQVPHEVGGQRDGAGAGGADPAGLVPVATGQVEQRGVRQRHLHRHRDHVGVTEDPLDEGVGHDLAAGALVAGGAGGVGAATQGGVHRHALGQRQQGGEPDHAVGDRPDARVPLGDGFLVPGHRGGRVGDVGQAVDLGAEAPLAPAGRGALLAHQLGVDPEPVDQAQAGGALGDLRGPPLRAPAGPHRGEGVGELLGQHHGEPEVDAAAVRRLPSGQRDLGADAALTHRLGLVRPLRDPRLLERHSGLRLHRAQRVLQTLRLGDQVDGRGVDLTRLQPPQYLRSLQCLLTQVAERGGGVHEQMLVEHQFERKGAGRWRRRGTWSSNLASR